MPEYKAPPLSWEWKLIASAIAILVFVFAYTIGGAYVIYQQNQRIGLLENGEGF